MYKILIIMRNHTNGICSEVLELESEKKAELVYENLVDKIQQVHSSIREVIKLY